MQAAPDDFRLDFYCIGAPKSRTTWLAQCLDEHPAVAVARIKENDFFVHRRGVFSDDPNPNYLKDWDWYRSLFDGAPSVAKKGDFSIKVWRNPEVAPKVLHDLFPDLKLIVSLRDPVRRAYSHYWYVYYRVRHWGGVPDTVEEAMQDEDFLDRSRYAKRLSAWLEHFPPDQLHVILDLDLNDDPEGEIRRLYQYLDVDDDFVPPSLETRINPPQGRRGIYGALYRTASKLRKIGLGPVIDVAKRVGVERAIDKVDKTEYEYPSISPEMEADLRQRLLPDIEELEAMLDRDLAAWKENGGTKSGRLDLPRGETRMKMFQMEEVTREQ